MIDNELREMFARREQLVPDPGALAGRIAIGVERRRIRTRSLRVAAVAAVVVGAIVVAGVLGSAGLRHNTQPVGPLPGPTPWVSTVDGLEGSARCVRGIPTLQ